MIGNHFYLSDKTIDICALVTVVSVVAYLLLMAMKYCK